MTQNSEARKRGVESIEDLLDRADAAERELLAGVKPVNAIKYGFRECVHCGATWEEEVAPVNAIRNLLNAYTNDHDSTIEPTDVDLIHEWLDFLA